MDITWFGHASFKLNIGNKIVYIDPFLGEYDGDADLILVTHSHFDHCDLKKIEEAKKDGTIIITSIENSSKISALGLRAGEQEEIDNIKIFAVDSYNIGKEFHPKGFGIGFILEAEKKRIYFAGDTDLIPEMKSYKTDIACLPVSGTYVMTSSEAVQAAKIIKPKIAIPLHYGGGIVGTDKDAEEFSKGLQGSGIKTRILKKGECFKF